MEKRIAIRPPSSVPFKRQRLGGTAIKLSDSRRAGETRAAQLRRGLAARVAPALQFCARPFTVYGLMG